MKIELKIPTMKDKEGLKAVCNAVEKVGFEYEGTRINGVTKGDKIYNLRMTGLLKEKFDGSH